MKRRIFALALSFALLPGVARAQLSESERKETARAAYIEGVALQEGGDAARALAKFEAAQRLFDAPTHLLRIAQCQAATGQLVEASTTYETLVRKALGPAPSSAFVDAQAQGKAELDELRPRIPTLHVTLTPSASSLEDVRITLNDKELPPEILGIARPLNPGRYALRAEASGWATAAPVAIEIRERDARRVALRLTERATSSEAPAPKDAPPVYGAPSEAPPETSTPAGAPPVYDASPAAKPASVPSELGLLLGLRPLFVMPAGQLIKDVPLDTYAAPGLGVGLDLMGRVGRRFLVGATLEWAALSEPKDAASDPVLANATEITPSATYAGLLVGFVPNVDAISFLGDVGVGVRALSRDVTLHGVGPASGTFSDSHTGVEARLGAGLSIPAGPFRIVPKADLAVGAFTDRECEGPGVSGCKTVDDAMHAIVTLGVGLYYSLDIGRKAPAPPPPRAASSD